MPRGKGHRMRIRRGAVRPAERSAGASGMPGGARAWLWAASRWPVKEAWTSAFEEHKIASVIVSREGPGGVIAAGVYLVDLGCLGVKDAFATVFHSPKEYRSFLRKMGRGLSFRRCEPSFAAKIVHTGLAYARRLGFPPHRDFHRSRHILREIDPADCPDEIECGMHGKPYYVAGPRDNVPLIMNRLRSRLGPEGFGFICPLTPEEVDAMEIREDEIPGRREEAPGASMRAPRREGGP